MTYVYGVKVYDKYFWHIIAFFGCITFEHIPQDFFILPQRNVLKNIHCCMILNGQKVERTLMSLNRGRNK